MSKAKNFLNMKEDLPYKDTVARELEEIESQVNFLKQQLHRLQDPEGNYDFEDLKKVSKACASLDRSGSRIMLVMTGKG